VQKALARDAPPIGPDSLIDPAAGVREPEGGTD
jgi:hypothetical protein